jgi:sRNA-binding protein
LKQIRNGAPPGTNSRRCCAPAFPAAFRGPPRPPLAVGIHQQILGVAGNDIDAYQLRGLLKWWCSRWDYRDAVAHGEMRVNLDGSPAGVPSEDQQLHAARQLKGRYGPMSSWPGSRRELR